MARPVVLSKGARVRITVDSGRPAVLTVDGQVQSSLVGADEVSVAAGPNATLFARVQDPTYFFKTLVARLVPRH
jgi:NAD kinase